jgi:signal transduction histidine kinase
VRGEVLGGDRIAIHVTDSGIGIPEEHLPRVFDVFYQVDGSSTREYGGAGLGLAIVKSFVEAHGGEVQIRSAPGAGSTFSVILPLRAASAPALTPAAPSSAVGGR